MNSNYSNNESSLARYWCHVFKLAIHRATRHWLVLIIVFACAVTLIALRGYALLMLPFWQKHIKLATVSINILADTFITLEDVVKIIVRIIQDLRAFFSSKYTPPPFHLLKFVKLDDNEVQAVLSEIAAAASLYNTGPKAAHFLLKTAASPALCPVLRAAAPTKVSTLFSVPLSWLSFAFDPLLGVDSCSSNIPDLAVHIVVAFGATGFIILEIVLPVYFGLIVLYTFLWPTLCTAVKLHNQVIAAFPKTFGFEAVTTE